MDMDKIWPKGEKASSISLSVQKIAKFPTKMEHLSYILACLFESESVRRERKKFELRACFAKTTTENERSAYFY